MGSEEGPDSIRPSSPGVYAVRSRALKCSSGSVRGRSRGPRVGSVWDGVEAVAAQEANARRIAPPLTLGPERPDRGPGSRWVVGMDFGRRSVYRGLASTTRPCAGEVDMRHLPCGPPTQQVATGCWAPSAAWW